MRILPYSQKVRIIAALVEGNSIRGTCRLTGCHQNTVARHALLMGEACWRLHDALMWNLQVDVLEFDEIWAFIRKKQRRVKPQDPVEFGDSYTFIALDATKKAVVGYLIGKRTSEACDAFAKDIRKRIVNQPQISTDGFQAYPAAISDAFGRGVDYAQILKTYGNPADNLDEPDIRYSRSKCITAQRVPVSGNPNRALISTSYVERQNLTIRMGVRRFTRLTNAYSKKARNHCAAVSLHVAHYNLCRVHETLKTTPGVALGVTDHVWSLDELIDTAGQLVPTEDEIGPVVPPENDRQLDLLMWKPTPRKALPQKAAPPLSVPAPAAPVVLVEDQLTLFGHWT